MQRRERQTLITVITATIGFVLIVTVLWLYARQYRMVAYNNSFYKFSLRYPATWSFAENKNGSAVIFYSPPENPLDRFSENVNIVVQDISKNPLDLEQYTKIAIDQMQAIFETNLEILDSTQVTMDGHQGHQLEFIGKGPDGNLHYLCRWTLIDTTAYQIAYAALEPENKGHLKSAQRMMHSFKIHSDN